MAAKLVAMVWWQAPHEACLERPIYADQIVYFGRDAKADIGIGQVPVYDPDVPRFWGEFSWHRGRLMVANVSDKWGFDVVSMRAGEAVGRQPVAPESSLSPSSVQFRIEAQAPDALHTLNVQCARRAPFNTPGGSQDPPSFVAFDLTPTQCAVGKAIVAPLARGRSRRAGYQEIAQSTNYSTRHVRETVAAIDALFVTHHLSEVDTTSDMLDRVALTLIRHPALLR